MHKKFRFTSDDDRWVLWGSTGNLDNQIIMGWSKKSYSRGKALNRADRYVGQEVRRGDAGDRYTYTQDALS